MKESRGGGALVTTIVGLLLCMLVMGWLVWGRGAWNRRQARLLLRQAIEAYQEGRDEEALGLETRARECAADSLLKAEERELQVRLLLLRARRHFERQAAMQGETQLRVPPRLEALRGLRDECRTRRLPCPAVVEWAGAYADSL